MVEWQRARFAVLAVTLLSARTSFAQGRHGQSGGAAASGSAPPVSTVTKVAPDEMSAAEGAEDRMRAGDCAGALDGFDLALRKYVSPELHRDRGLCHEKLGHPYPAMDDYRVYLEARPNAPDADKIRARLVALETRTGTVKPVDKDAGVTLAIGSDTGTSDLGSLEATEQLDSQADGSSLRRGRGFAFGLAFDLKHYGTSGFGWAEGGTVNLRYTWSALSTVYVELQINHVDGSGTASSLSGPGFFGGYEARLPLDKRVDDAILLGGTLGYDHLTQNSIGAVYSAIEPLFRGGYRHVFGPSLGLEATLDVGPAFLHLTGTSGANDTTLMIGGHVGLVLGF